MRIEIFPRRNWLGKLRWYFRVRAANGQIIAQSEGYSRRTDCQATAASLRKNVGAAEIFGALA